MTGLVADQGVGAVTGDTGWHVADDMLRRYINGALGPPWLWSVETHLDACDGCRRRLAAEVDPGTVAAGWSRLDAAIDVPERGWMERALVRLGVPEATARLVAVTPGLRTSWLAAVALTLTLTTLACYLAQKATTPVLFLAVAPALPVAGVALSFGPRFDPTYEMAAVAPLHTFRLLLLRTMAVLGVTSVLSGCASLALPGFGLVVLGWLLPAVALTLLTLALIPRVGPTAAPALVGVGWVTALIATVHAGKGSSVIFTGAGQLGAAGAVLIAGLALLLVRPAFETSRHFTVTPAEGFRRPT